MSTTVTANWRKALWLIALAGYVMLFTTQVKSASITIEVKNQKGAALPNAVVTLTAANREESKHEDQTAIIDQVNKEFEPQVSVVQAGTAIGFPNNDNVLHHVYSFSKTKSFDLPLYAGTPSEPVVFDTPGLVTLGCNIHDWMRAYVVVVDTPYFKMSDENGIANIQDMPQGEYELEVWHPRQRKPFKRTVSVHQSDSLSLEIATKPQLKSRRDSSGTSRRYKP